MRTVLCGSVLAVVLAGVAWAGDEEGPKAGPAAEPGSKSTPAAQQGPKAPSAEEGGPTASELLSKQIDDANKDFLGVKFGLAVGALMVKDQVDEVKAVGSGSDAKVVVTKSSSSRAVTMLESHKFIDVAAAARRSRVRKAQVCEVQLAHRLIQEPKAIHDDSCLEALAKTGRLPNGDRESTEKVSFGLGPFVGVMPGQGEAIQGIALGGMAGLRVGGTSAFCLGVGAVLDPKATVLAEGVVDGGPVPKGEDPILTVEKSKWGLVVLASFSF
jgi:hypothetical protein